VVSEPQRITFSIMGPPVPKERARRGKGGHWFTPKKTRAYEALVGMAAMAKKSLVRDWPMDAEYMLHVRLYFPNHRRRDADNVIKSVQDGLRGVLYHDDHRVGVLCPPWEVDRERPRAEVTVEVLA
jgi:Holliday junction resolvase RusA-like endonuclease